MTQNTNPVLFDIPMPIITPRLILRPVQTGDGKAIHEAKKETWQEINQWMPWTKGGIKTAEEDEITARTQHAKFILREDIMILGIERATNIPVVFTGLHRFDWETRQFEIGYWVRKSAHNKGYATESTNALLRYAFDELNATRVAITHAQGNKPSARVIEKLGFKQEGIKIKAEHLPDGSIVDLHEYARTNLNDLPGIEINWGEEP